MASNLLNIDTLTLNNSATGSSNKSLYIGNYGGTPTVSIFGGGDSTILGNPLGNLDKLFFYSGFDYLRVRSAVNFTINLPDRALRSSGGGKKGSSALTSYNGYSDWVIYEHDYGSPTPAFSMYLNSASSTGGTLLGNGATLAGSVPLQFQSADSFRLGVVYSTDKYLILRERYQVWHNDLPPVSLNCTAYFYNNPTSIASSTALAILHSPETFNDVSPFTYSPVRGRFMSETVTFTAQQGQSFNKVEVFRYGGGAPTAYGTPFLIYQINGGGVSAFDPYGTSFAQSGDHTYTYSTMQTSWSMTVQIQDVQYTDAVHKTKYVFYAPKYAVRFTNTNTGQTFTDNWGGVVSFYISP
jgi:hypothetical protein